MLKRVNKELRDHELQPADGVHIKPTLFPPNENTARHSLNAFIVGPEGSPYEGGLFKLFIELPNDYPFRPSRINYLTKVYHPNINCNGSMSLRFLYDEWSPALTMQKVLKQVRMLLMEPNPDNPLVPQVAHQYKSNREQFNKTAAEWTAKYAN